MTENIEAKKEIPKRPSKSTPERKGRKLGIRTKLALGALTLAGLTFAANEIGLIDLSLGSLNPAPGQTVGKTKLTDSDVMKFRASGTDALGEATVEVKDIEQQWIDKPEKGDKEATVHETMHLTRGQYIAQWVVEGKWSPQVQKDGDVVVTLPATKGKNIVTVNDPVIDKNRTDRAFLQGLAGVLGADDTDDAVARKNTRTLLTQWVKDPNKSKDFFEATSCVAIAGAAQKAASLSLSTAANFETFTPARTRAPEKNSKLPTISFQAADTNQKDGILTMQECLPILDGLGFNPKTLKTGVDSAFGLATHRIDKLELPARVQ